VFTGDIANRGEAEAYQAFKKSAARLVPEYYVMMGNHDERTSFCQNFPGTARDDNGFVQQVIKTDLGHFLLLDTATEQASWGEYCEQRALWLKDRLLEADGLPVYIFMHHPPFDIGLACMDRLKLLDITHFAAAIDGFTNIRHIFLGHVHRIIHGSWRNIPYSILPGTNHQVAFNHNVLSPVPHSLEPPAYGMVLIDKDQVIVHLHFYSQNKDLAISDTAKLVEKT